MDTRGAWQFSASSFNWTREILRAARTPHQILTDDLASVCRVVEIELGQCFRSFPGLAGDDVAELRDALDRLGVRVSVVGASLDDYLSPESRRTEPGRLAFLEPQLRAARRLGATGVRVPFGQPGPALIMAVEPLLDELNLTLYQEIQGHDGPGRPGYAETMTLLAERDNPRLRLIIDTSMLTPQLPVTYLDALQESAVPGDIVQLASSAWGRPEAMDAIRRAIPAGRIPPADLPLFVTMIVRFGTWTAEDLHPLLPFVGGWHLKFWDLADADDRVSGPLRDLRPLIDRPGFAGTVCSEWGGHDWYAGPLSAAEMTRQHLVLAESILRPAASGVAP